jgi:hypothetical protein
MSGTHVSSDAATQASAAATLRMRLEVMVVPVADVDRASRV